MSCVIFALGLSPATAQYPGFSSDASSASVSADDDSASARSRDAASDSQSDAANDAANDSQSDAASDVANDAANNAANDSGRDDGGDTNFNTSENARKTLTRQKPRQRYFIRKLRLEFAGMELIERKTGVPFSRDDVPRYLDELRAELAMMGTANALAVQSLAGDTRHIETEINQHIDHLLGMIGAPKNGSRGLATGFFTPIPPLPKTVDAVTAKMAALSLKYELMEYGEKALQAMGAYR
ncbi:MAG: hypothetical protein ACO34H_05150 [Candidatus Puniceispirillaceae bacterium]